MRNLGNQNSYRPWSEEEVKNLVKLSESNKTIEEISIALNRPYESVKQKLKKTKIKAKPLRNNIWSEEEKDILADMWSKNTSTKNIAKRLGRSEGAIKQQATRMLLCERGFGSMEFTVPEIIYGLNIKRDHVYNWIKKDLLKAKKSKYGKYLITQSDLLKFLKANPEKYNANKIEIGFIVPEPDWLTKKRKSDSIAALQSKLKSKADKYRPSDIARMKTLIAKGYSNKEIAEKLERTPIAIKVYRNKHKL